jgi:hypothetical protein
MHGGVGRGRRGDGFARFVRYEPVVWRLTNGTRVSEFCVDLSGAVFINSISREREKIDLRDIAAETHRRSTVKIAY